VTQTRIAGNDARTENIKPKKFVLVLLKHSKSVQFTFLKYENTSTTKKINQTTDAKRTTKDFCSILIYIRPNTINAVKEITRIVNSDQIIPINISMLKV
jgi:hypothetical protein